MSESSQVDRNRSLIASEKVLFPTETILDGEYFEAGQDFEIPIPGFFILAAKREGVRSIADFTDLELTEFSQMLKKIRLAMREVLNIKDVYLFQNEDSVHGFHFWCFPRYQWMEERFGKKVESVRPSMLYALEAMKDEATITKVKEDAAKVRDYLSKK